MATVISPLASVDPGAIIDHDVEIGPFCYVGPHVRIGRGTVLEHHVSLMGHTTIGQYNRFSPNSVIGGDPQDMSFQGSETKVIIGDHNVFREGVTVHRGAEKEDGITRIDNYNIFFANAHVAHNCHIYDHVIIVNAVLLGGHVHVHNYATISGNSVVHHFARVGEMAYVGGMSRVTVDVPPYMMCNGCEKFEVITVNSVGLKRRGIPSTTIELLKRAHRLMYRQKKSVAASRLVLQAEITEPWPEELLHLLDFVDELSEGAKGRSRESARNKKAA